MIVIVWNDFQISNEKIVDADKIEPHKFVARSQIPAYSPKFSRDERYTSMTNWKLPWKFENPSIIQKICLQPPLYTDVLMTLNLWYMGVPSINFPSNKKFQPWLIAVQINSKYALSSGYSRDFRSVASTLINIQIVCLTDVQQTLDKFPIIT